MFFKRGLNKKGVEWELGKIIIAVVVLVIMVFAILFLLKGKGGDVLSSIKNLLHFGKA
jgi:hypothetical protein